MLKCNVCGGELNGTALVVTVSQEVLDGVAVVAFPAGGLDTEALRAFGVCGIPCATRKFSDALAEARGVRKAVHMGPGR